MAAQMVLQLQNMMNFTYASIMLRSTISVGITKHQINSRFIAVTDFSFFHLRHLSEKDLIG